MFAKGARLFQTWNKTSLTSVAFWMANSHNITYRYCHVERITPTGRMIVKDSVKGYLETFNANGEIREADFRPLGREWLAELKVGSEVLDKEQANV